MSDLSNSKIALNPSEKNFKIIGIVGQPRHDITLEMHKSVYIWLEQRGFKLLVEKKIATILQLEPSCYASIDEIGAQADLAIVIGGDGNMLGAARIFAKYPKIMVVGINRGNLGFLTDIDPNDVYEQLTSLLYDADYIIEPRFLLEAQVIRNGEIIADNYALNEVIIHPQKVARMISFDVYIDDKFVFSQRSDGLIIATPTGSTAYSLSVGGPILNPQLNALCLVPMFPHTLSSRPLVINADSKISFKFPPSNLANLELDYDGQIQTMFTAEDEIVVRKSKYILNLVHLKNYNYYNILTSKLGWLSKPF